MLKKIDHWLASLPEALAALIIFTIVFVYGAVTAFFLHTFNNDPDADRINLSALPDQYSIDEVIKQYDEEDLDRFLFNYSQDMVSMEDYESLSDELRDYEYHYENALDVIEEYVRQYGEMEGYTHQDYLMDGYEMFGAIGTDQQTSANNR